MEIYEFTQGMLHSKLVIIDKHWGLIGSANMDERSFRLNFEVTAVLYDSESTHQLHADFESMLANSAKPIIAEGLNDNVFYKLKIGAARLLSPMY